MLPHSLELIIEALAPAFADSTRPCFIVTEPNSFLEEDLISIGLRRAAKGKFEIVGPPIHPFTHDALEYFAYCKARERYMLGISQM